MGQSNNLWSKRRVLQKTAKELSEETQGNITAQSLDIRDSLAIEETINNIFDEGPLDGLVNNAAEILLAEQMIYHQMDLTQLLQLYFMELLI